MGPTRTRILPPPTTPAPMPRRLSRAARPVAVAVRYCHRTPPRLVRAARRGSGWMRGDLLNWFQGWSNPRG